MVDIYDFIETSSVADLQDIKTHIDKELARRRDLERLHLINEFQKAWAELKDAGVHITYCDEYEDEFTHLDQWDGFNFD